MTATRRLRENIISLFTLQGVNYLLPLIILPYLVRVLGPGQFGLIAFAQALLQYFVVLTDYGFNLTATRDIAVHRDDAREVSEIFSTVIIIKFGLMLMSLIAVTILVFAVPKFREQWPVYFVTFPLVVGQALFPVWFFQGMERMRYITGLNLSGRLLATICVFVFVRDQSDVLLAAGLQAGGPTLTGVLGLCTVRLVAPIRLVRPSLEKTWATLRDGWYVFVSQVSSALGASSGTFVLGLFHGHQVVGYYSIAQKIVMASSQVTVQLGTAVYPRSSALFAQAYDEAVRFIRKVLFFGGLLLLLVSSALFLSADLIALYVTGEAGSPVGLLIRIMSGVIILSFVDNVYGTQILLPLGMNKEFMKAILYPSIFFMATALLLAPAFAGVGTAVAVVASQTMVMVLMVLPVHRRGIKLHKST